MNVEQIAEQYFARIHRAALVLCGNPWDADDLAQETFLVLARQIDDFQGRSSIYTWLYGVLLNLERRERRRYGTRNRKLKIVWENEAEAASAAPPAAAAAEASEWKQSLWSRVAQLPDGQRQTLVLRFSEGLAYHEIADTLGCPLGTVKSRIFHGLAALRRALEEEGEDARRLPDFPQEDVNHAG
ncbi:MAG: RNA polymerase sigma factor [Planctomycetes bacterium]|nr:RNA polymerase sigma factor [Planctomycetota bacterium]